MLVRFLPAVLVLGALAPSASAAPADFYGVMYDGDLRDSGAAVQHRAWKAMRSNGVGSVRTMFSWTRAQAEEGAAFDFSQTDALVRRAVQRRLTLLPVVEQTPLWARSEVSNWWPEHPADYGAYVSALVGRYGPDGSFWTENKGLAKRPLRHWQFYNEPALSKQYGPALKAGYRAAKRADRGSKVVLAGLTGTPHGTPWDVLRFQYRKGGIKGLFDIAAIHMYTGKPENVIEGVKLFRKVMRRHGDGGKPIWLTEFGITASKGRTDAPRSQRTLRTTDKGMARFLRIAYRRLARGRREVGLGRAYWYTWASSYQRGAGIFRFTGLYRFADGELKAKPALAAYRESARR